MVKNKFIEYQHAFYKKVKCSPYIVTLRHYTVENTDALHTFLGDSTRSFKDYPLPVLFEKTVNPRIREKYGLPDTIDSIIFVSPLQLKMLIGVERINKNTFTVILEGEELVINNVTYLEAIYGSCISLRMDLKNSLKGG